MRTNLLSLIVVVAAALACVGVGFYLGRLVEQPYYQAIKATEPTSQGGVDYIFVINTRTGKVEDHWWAGGYGYRKAQE